MECAGDNDKIGAELCANASDTLHNLNNPSKVVDNIGIFGLEERKMEIKVEETNFSSPGGSGAAAAAACIGNTAATGDDDDDDDDDEGEDLSDSFFDDFSNTDFMAQIDIVGHWIIDDDNTNKSQPLDTNAAKGSGMEKQEKISKDISRVERDDSRYRRSRHSRDRHSRSKYSRGKYSRGRYSRSRHSRDRHMRDRRSRERILSREKVNRGWRKSREQRARSKEYERLRARRSGERERSIGRRKSSARVAQEQAKESASKPSCVKKIFTDEMASDFRRDPEKTRRDIEKDKIRCAKDHEAKVFQEQLKVAETGLVPPGTEREAIMEAEKHKLESDELLLEKSEEKKRLEKEKDMQLRVHLQVRRRHRYVCELSPVSETRLSPMSSSLELSDRETWLRSQERQRPRYSRSCSPISSNSLSDSGYRKRKRSRQSSLKEEQKPVKSTSRSTETMSVAPYYPPFQHNLEPHDLFSKLYSQQPQHYVPMVADTYAVFQPPAASYVDTPVDAPPAADASVPHTVAACNLSDNSEFMKLFEDKKISLSDYLSVSAKSLDSATPHNVHNRIKVISRCQEAIKALADDSKLWGRFFPRLPQGALDYEADKATSSYKSPLRRAAPVRLKFTTPNTKKRSSHSKTLLHKLFSYLGIQDGLSSAAAPAKLPETTTLGASSGAQWRCSVFTQCDEYRCRECENRKQVEYTSQGTQTTDKATFDVSTQVCVEDLTKSSVTFTPRGIFRSNLSGVQSISHLTPAQLLAQQDIPRKEDVPVWINSPFAAARSGPADRFAAKMVNPKSLFSSAEVGFAATKEKSIFGGSMLEGVGSSSFSGAVERLPFMSSMDREQFGSAAVGRGSMYSDTGYLEDSFPFDSAQQCSDSSNPHVTRARNALPRVFQGGGSSTFQNRPYFN